MYIQSISSCILQAELIQVRGYKSETHRVVTADGYVLEIHRIPHGRQNNHDHHHEQEFHTNLNQIHSVSQQPFAGGFHGQGNGSPFSRFKGGGRFIRMAGNETTADHASDTSDSR